MEKKDLGNEVIYIEPDRNLWRLFKKVFLGVDVFDEGIIKNQIDTKDKNNSMKIEVYEVEQNGI